MSRRCSLRCGSVNADLAVVDCELCGGSGHTSDGCSMDQKSRMDFLFETGRPGGEKGAAWVPTAERRLGVEELAPADAATVVGPAEEAATTTTTIGSPAPSRFLSVPSSRFEPPEPSASAPLRSQGFGPPRRPSSAAPVAAPALTDADLAALEALALTDADFRGRAHGPVSFPPVSFPPTHPSAPAPSRFAAAGRVRAAPVAATKPRPIPISPSRPVPRPTSAALPTWPPPGPRPTAPPGASVDGAPLGPALNLYLARLGRSRALRVLATAVLVAAVIAAIWYFVARPRLNSAAPTGLPRPAASAPR